MALRVPSETIKHSRLSFCNHVNGARSQYRSLSQIFPLGLSLSKPSLIGKPFDKRAGLVC